MAATVEQLQSLKLFGMLDAWVEQQTLPSYQDLSFDERFALFVEREHLRRVHLRQQRRLKQACLPVKDASLEAIDYTRSRGLRKAQILELAGGAWLTQHLQVIVVGPTGIGKTFVASVLAKHLTQLGYTVRYYKTHELLRELKLATADGSFEKRRKQLANFQLLILDEWLRDALDVNDAREILDLLDDRYRQRSCLWITQLPVEQWHPQLKAPTIADAVLDRIIHDSIRLSLNGESMRKLTSPIQSQNSPQNQTESQP